MIESNCLFIRVKVLSVISCNKAGIIYENLFSCKIYAFSVKNIIWIYSISIFPVFKLSHLLT